MARRSPKIDRLDLYGLRGQRVRDWDLWTVALYLAALGVGLWGLVNW